MLQLILSQYFIPMYVHVIDSGLKLHPGAMVASKKLTVKKTVHKCLEIQAGYTRNKMEEALLKKKTTVLATSEPVELPFMREVLNQEEANEDEEVFSRFFPTQMMDSCYQPDAKYGADPILVDRKYRLTLVQGADAVDVFEGFRAGEMVLDVEVLKVIRWQ